MRGFRTGRAVQNSKSSQLAKQSHLTLIQGGLSDQTTAPQQKVPLPDWLKVPQAVIDAQKGARPDAFGVLKTVAAPKRKVAKVVKLAVVRKKAVSAKRATAKRAPRKTTTKRKAA